MSSNKGNIWYFEDVDLFNVLCPRKVGGMEDNHPTNQYKKDEFIYFPNEPSNYIFMIAQGRVKIGSYSDEGKEIIKTILTAGELFGEMALTGQDKRTDFAQAMDNDVVICSMSIEDMQLLMKDDQTLAFKIFKLIGFRLRKIERRLESLVFKDARSRVVEFIREMAEEKGQKVAFETMIKSHLTHKDIAGLIVSTRVTVTTILNELRAAGNINYSKGEIVIRDIKKFRAA